MSKLIQKGGYILRFRYFRRLSAYIRRVRFSLLGMKIGKRTYLPKVFIPWPNQVFIGNDCTVEHSCYFKFDGIWQEGFAINIGNRVFIGEGCEFNIRNSIHLGDRCLIASGCRFVDHDHGIKGRGPIRGQKGTRERIVIENDAWLGCNVIVLKGVTIGTGAVVAAGAVVTKSIPAFEIWAGVPAKKIGERN